ncbi:hypothetical protein H8E88_28350 [candidate division KSB1 bacterium]|nr:hypothetical protein [candidate division KSB1 bacterium]
MRTIIRGEIEKYVLFFKAYLDYQGNLVLDENGEFSITIDTGFSGGIALPIEMLDKMKIDQIDYDTFKLATGEIIELPVFIGKAVVKKLVVETWFIPGDFLLGMEFLSSLGKILSMDYDDKTVKLEDD